MIIFGNKISRILRGEEKSMLVKRFLIIHWVANNYYRKILILRKWGNFIDASLQGSLVQNYISWSFKHTYSNFQETIIQFSKTIHGQKYLFERQNYGNLSFYHFIFKSSITLMLKRQDKISNFDSQLYLYFRFLSSDCARKISKFFLTKLHTTKIRLFIPIIVENANKNIFFLP